MNFKNNNRVKLTAFLVLIVFNATAQPVTISVETKDNALVLQTDKANHLWTIHFGKKMHTGTERPVQLNGLDEGKNYRIKEINLYPGTTSTIDSNKIYSGDFLMKAGINPDLNSRRTSVILEINEVK